MWSQETTPTICRMTDELQLGCLVFWVTAPDPDCPRNDTFKICWGKAWLQERLIHLLLVLESNRSQAVHGSADLLALPTQRLRSLRRSEEYSRWQFTGISGWFALDKCSSKPPKSSLLGTCGCTLLSTTTYISNIRNLQILLLKWQHSQFCNGQNCMNEPWFQCLNQLEINLFPLLVYIFFAMCFIVLLCYLNIFTHHWALSKLYLLTAKNNTCLVKKKKKKEKN